MGRLIPHLHPSCANMLHLCASRWSQGGSCAWQKHRSNFLGPSRRRFVGPGCTGGCSFGLLVSVGPSTTSADPTKPGAQRCIWDCPVFAWELFLDFRSCPPTSSSPSPERRTDITASEGKRSLSPECLAWLEDVSLGSLGSCLVWTVSSEHAASRYFHSRSCRGRNVRGERQDDWCTPAVMVAAGAETEA